LESKMDLQHIKEYLDNFMKIFWMIL
jgi:hypothetical protein